MSSGLTRKSSAPSFIAVATAGRSSNAVISTTSISGARSFNRRRSSTPLTPGIRTSRQDDIRPPLYDCGQRRHAVYGSAHFRIAQ
jgi:hypothetical protein